MFFLVYGVGTFVYYKVAAALVFSGGMNLVSAAVSAAATAGLLFYLAGAVMSAYGRYAFRRQFEGKKESLAELIFGQALPVVFVNIAVLWLLQYGFDPGLADTIDPGFFSRYSGPEWGPFLAFAAVVSLPVIIYGSVTGRILAQMRDASDREARSAKRP